METILFTGARSGLAAAVIEKLKHKNYNIIVSVHNQKQLELVQEYYKNDLNVTCIKLDVTKKEDLKQLENLDIDILVSNAAIGYGGSIAEMPIEKIKDNFEVNVFSYFEIIQIVLKNMIKKKKGRIINMASLAGIIPIPFLGSYCATKASIIKMTSCLKKELKNLNLDIDVCLIEPGLYHTGFNQVMFEDKYKQMDIDTYFYNQIEQIRKKEKRICLFEKKNFNSIVKKIITAITTSHPRFIYRSPISQVIGAKAYQILFE